MRTAVINSSGLVVNVIELAEGAMWAPPEGHTLRPSDTACIGDTWDGEAFVKPYIEPAFDSSPQSSANEVLLSQIRSLEVTVTERRVREAVLGVDNGWLKNLNDQIAVLRAQLTKETTNG